MLNQENSQFRADELVVLSHYDKATGQYVKTLYPKIAGRLRLAHEGNEALSIETSVIQIDDSVAIIGAKCCCSKGEFGGIGLASVERDKRLALSIVELAETRAIARALRFAGYGSEYCSAEEVSHLLQTDKRDDVEPPIQPARAPQQPIAPENTPAPIGQILDHHPLAGARASSNFGNGNGGNGGNGNGGDNGNGGNGKGRLSSKQHKYILSLAQDAGMDRNHINQQCLAAYGVGLDFLNKTDASCLINELLSQ
jgi:hypothetical protein